MHRVLLILNLARIGVGGEDVDLIAAGSRGDLDRAGPSIGCALAQSAGVQVGVFAGQVREPAAVISPWDSAAEGEV